MGVLFEIFLETLVADQLLLEFDGLFAHDGLGVERLKHRLASRLEPADLVPYDRDALEHVLAVEVLGEFLLKELHAFDGLAFVRLYQGDDRTLFMSHEASCFFIGVISDGHIEVDYIDHVFHSRGSLGVASVELNNHIELANMEEVANGLDLVLCHVRGEYKGFHVEAIEEYFDSVSLNHVFSKDDSLALNNRHLKQAEQEDEPIQAGLTK